jgi:starch-binding outer membrane protein, SusD/RagB family
MKINIINLSFFWRQTILICTAASVVSCLNSCNKIVEVPPPTDGIVGSNVFTDNTTAIAYMTGIYMNMTNVFSLGSTFTGSQGISLLTGLSSDELTLYSGVTNQMHVAYYENNLSANAAQPAGSEYWPSFYDIIYKCNAAIQGLASTSPDVLTPSVKKQLQGEAKFMRAFIYFYLVNLYGDVPLSLSTDYKTNSLLSRSPKSVVYEQIVSDLSDAKSLLTDNFPDITLLNTSLERVRPTKWAAAALLARVYLYTENYVNAETEASAVIDNSSLFSLSPLNEVFLKNSGEAIWQLQPTRLYFNTEEAVTFIIPPSGLSEGNDVFNPVYISSQLLGSFEAGDQRRMNEAWIDSLSIGSTIYYFPYKYKKNEQDLSITASDGLSEYLMVLRLGEQYLIRAEVRAQQGNFEGARNDLNAIRTRAGLMNTTANDQVSLLDIIAHERQVELFTEWGHRWLDLKRTGRIDAVMNIVTPLKASGATWNSYQQLYPLPNDDLQKDQNLTQNEGY